MQSYIGCIYLTCLHCVFLNVFSMYLDQRRHNRIGLAFPHCVFSSASSNFLFDTVNTYNGCICLSFSHCAFPNATSNFLDQKCKITLFAFVKMFLSVWCSLEWYACKTAYSYCLHLFDFSPLCIFGNPNNIRVWSFWENWIIFVFVFGPFWKAE